MYYSNYYIGVERRQCTLLVSLPNTCGDAVRGRNYDLHHHHVPIYIICAMYPAVRALYKEVPLLRVQCQPPILVCGTLSRLSPFFCVLCCKCLFRLVSSVAVLVFVCLFIIHSVNPYIVKTTGYRICHYKIRQLGYNIYI